jgi:TolB-like protein
MPASTYDQIPPIGPLSDGDEEIERREEKKRAKLRSAWISFVGRILAQILGAVATISLGLMVVQKYVPAGGPAPAPAAATPAVPARLATPGVLSLAVLPFESISSDGDRTFASGMTDALITNLAQLDGLHVVSRTSSGLYEAGRRQLPDIARELSVGYVVEGVVTRADGRVRVTVRLIDAARDEHVVAKSYDRSLRNVLPVQAEIAGDVARSIKDTLTSGTRPSPIVSRREVKAPGSR